MSNILVDKMKWKVSEGILVDFLWGPTYQFYIK